MAQSPFEFEEAEQYHNDEVLNTRRELQQSCANLEQLAQYCEQSYVTHQDQQVHSKLFISITQLPLVYYYFKFSNCSPRA